jgi:uncharacterized protein (TIGR01244 family)
MRAIRLIAAAAAYAVYSLAGASGTGNAPIENFVRIDARVSAGANLTAAQIEWLRAEGVRTIVDLREPAELGEPSPAEAARKSGIRYVAIPVKTAAPQDEQARSFLAALKDSEAVPVFLTCRSGNRAGAFWMIRRMVVDGWSAEDAEKEARRIGLKSPHLAEFARAFAARHSRETAWPSICRSLQHPANTRAPGA